MKFPLRSIVIWGSRTAFTPASFGVCVASERKLASLASTRNSVVLPPAAGDRVAVGVEHPGRRSPCR